MSKEEKKIIEDWFDKVLKNCFGQRAKVYIFDFFKIINLIIWPWLRLRGFFLKEAKIHLACGAVHLPSWLNIDGNPFRRPDIWLDLRNRFPFGQNKISYIVACHFIEHLYEEERWHFLSECYRVLKHGGIIRISVPCIDKIIKKYLSTGSSADAARRLEHELLLEGGHRSCFNGSLLIQTLRKAGFVDVEKIDVWSSKFLSNEEISKMEQFPEITVCVEGIKD